MEPLATRTAQAEEACGWPRQAVRVMRRVTSAPVEPLPSHRYGTRVLPRIPFVERILRRRCQDANGRKPPEGSMQEKSQAEACATKEYGLMHRCATKVRFW